MTLWDFTKDVIKGLTREVVNNMGSFQSDFESGDGKIGGKTVAEWDAEWIDIGMLKTANLTPYGRYVGLYRHVINGRTMYVGRAVEWNNGGFRKRLSDYRRNSDSARTHTSGKMIHEHLDEIRTFILVVGSDSTAAEVTKRLEGKFIARYGAPWNKMLNI